jgi:type IV pilus assembly protein PilN
LSRVGLAPATEIADPLSRRLAPIRINLLPHREMRRERRKKDFVVLSALVAMAGVAAVFAGGFTINQSIAQQQDRNDFIKAENAKLDTQIAEIRTLRAEIAALKARQQAVEALQTDRTVPVRLFDELVKLAPEGLYLRQLRQDEAKVTLTGHAQSNERVAELLRNLADRSPWLDRPELGEIKEVVLQPTQGQKEGRKVYEFSLNALVKRPSAAGDAKPGGPPRTTGAGPAPSAATEPLKLGAAQ